MTLIGSSQNLVRPIISSRMTAALLTRMSSSAVFALDLGEERFHLFVIAVIDTDRDALPAGGGHLLRGLVDCSWLCGVGRGFAAAGDIDDGSMAAEGVRDTGTGTSAGSGHYCNWWPLRT